MKYVDNFQFVEDEWIQELLLNEGQARPRDWPPAFAVESAEYKRAEEAGYDLTQVHWWVYEEQNLGPLLLPLENEYHWWITKLCPGQFMPMHSDPHTHERPCKRYWIPLQNFEPGHVFIYKDNLIKDYKELDVFEYESSTDLHGAANIGHTPRVILQVTEFL